MYKENQNKNKNVKTAKIWQTLILQNCLPLGKHARFTSKNVAQYLLGSRNDYNLFKFNEIKHLLLKFTPLIETLFRAKLALNTKVGEIHIKKLVQPTPPKDPNTLPAWKEKMKNIKILKHKNEYYYKAVETKRPVKILFASINPTYDQIIREAASACQMSAKTNRWLCGYITANSQYLAKKERLNEEVKIFGNVSVIEKQFDKAFKANKEAKEKRYYWHYSNIWTQRPALAIIPDIHMNDMILRETTIKNIPVIGLVNTDEATKIAYPIFGNASSTKIVYFFCNFLAMLIAKAFAQQEYKQASHRIFNRSRAYLEKSSKTLKLSSVDTYTKTQIIAQTQIFPTIIKGTKHPRVFSLAPRRNIRKSIMKNITTFAHFPFNSILNCNKNSNIDYNKGYSNNYNKNYKMVRNVGVKPYWKNLKRMIFVLKLKIEDVQNNIISSKDMKTMLNTRKQIRIWKQSRKINKILLKTYAKKLRLVKLHKAQSVQKLRERLYTQKWAKKKFLRLKAHNLDSIRKNCKILQIKPKFRLKKYDPLRKKQLKTKLRKFLVKSLGHKGVLRKEINEFLAWDIFELQENPGRIKRFAPQVVLHLRRVAQLKKKLIKNKSETVNAITQLYNKLIIQKNKIKATTNTETKVKKILQLLFTNKQWFEIFLKKYPFFTLASQNLMNRSLKTRKKFEHKVLFSEFINKRKNPYNFAMNNFKRSQTMTHNLTWQNLVLKHLIIKENKSRFKERFKHYWATKKLRTSGYIKKDFAVTTYFFKKLVELQKRKHFPILVNQIKKSMKTKAIKITQAEYKSTREYIWYKRKYRLKFDRAHAVIPYIANLLVPYNPKYKPLSRKEKIKQRIADIKLYRQQKAAYKAKKYGYSVETTETTNTINIRNMKNKRN